MILCDNLASARRLGFCRGQALVFDDQTGKVSLSWRLWHLSQAGWCQSFIQPWEDYLAYLHVGLDWTGTLPLMAL